MAVGDAGDDRLTLEIDDARRRAGHGCHACIRPDRKDPVAGDGDRLRYRERGIDGDDLAVGENEISGTATDARRLTCAATASGRAANSTPAAPTAPAAF